MSNIKKARYTNAIQGVSKDFSVIKVTGTSKNIKQINYFLPKGHGLKKTQEVVFALFLEKKGKVAVIDFLKVNDWISVDEYDEYIILYLYNLCSVCADNS
jgi:hypothetical protein